MGLLHLRPALRFWTTPGLGLAGGGVELNLTAPAITPTLGSELLTNGNMEAGSPPSSWIAGGTTPTSVADERTGGSGAQAIQVARGAGQTAINYTYQGATTVIGGWYKLDYWMRNVDATNGGRTIVNTMVDANNYSTSTAWANRKRTDRVTNTSSFVRMTYATGAEGQSVRFDDVSLKRITWASMITLLGDIGRQTGTWTCRPTVANHTQAGMLINYEDDSNLVMMYVDRQDDDADLAYLVKYISGTPTTVVSGTVTYNATDELKVIADGTDYSLWYNGIQVGSATAITDSGLGTKVYGFSTDAESEVGQVTTSPLAS